VRARAILLIAGANVLGGLSYLGQKLAGQGLPDATVVAGRNAIALVCLGVWMWAGGLGFARWSRADWVRAVLLGTAAYGLPMLLGAIGVRHAPSANGAILILLEPGAILLLCWLLLRERLGAGQIAGVLLGLCGALVVVLGERGFDGLRDLARGEYFRGNLILAVHGLLWGLYTPISKSLADKHGPIEITFSSVLFSLLLLVPMALAEREQWRAGPELWPALGWTAALGVVVTFVSTVMWLAALKHLAASHVAVFIFLQPIVGVLASIGLLGEPFALEVLWGGLVIAAGVLVSTFWPGKKA
jgi:drug/metabolite transporter (DMT)-like permease